MSAGEWIALAALLITVIGGGFAGWNSLRNEIRDSRHKTMNDLVPKFEKIDDELGELGDRISDLDRRVTRIEPRGVG